MNKFTKKHPPVCGKRMAACLVLAKRPNGVSQIEATRGGGGTRLAAQIGKLKERGHLFRREWEQDNGSRFMRYWWLGFEDVEGGSDEG